AAPVVGGQVADQLGAGEQVVTGRLEVGPAQLDLAAVAGQGCGPGGEGGLDDLAWDRASWRQRLVVEGDREGRLFTATGRARRHRRTGRAGHRADLDRRRP